MGGHEHHEMGLAWWESNWNAPARLTVAVKVFLAPTACWYWPVDPEFWPTQRYGGLSFGRRSHSMALAVVDTCSRPALILDNWGFPAHYLRNGLLGGEGKMKRQFRGSSKPALVAKLLGGQTLDIVLKLHPFCLGLPLGALAIFF